MLAKRQSAPCSKWSQALKREKWGLQHVETGETFAMSQWTQRSYCSLYVAYRYVMAVYHLGVLSYLLALRIMAETESVRWLYFLVYLTNWSYTVLTLTNILRFVNAVRHMNAIKIDEQLPVNSLIKTQWFFENLTNTAAPFVTLIYWTFLYEEGKLSVVDVLEHGLNSVFVALDLVVVGSPVFLRHLYMPVLYIAAYATFTLVFFAAGGVDPDGNPWIYPVLDYNNWAKTGPFFVMIFVAVCLIFVIVWFLSTGRELFCHWLQWRRPCQPPYQLHV